MLIGAIHRGVVPPEVEAASAVEWDVPVDAYLMNAARVGDRFTASVYLDRSRKALDGMTVVTPPVCGVANIQGYEMVRSVCGRDYYVIVSRLQG